jgi:hypothetical protein
MLLKNTFSLTILQQEDNWIRVCMVSFLEGVEDETIFERRTISIV